MEGSGTYVRTPAARSVSAPAETPTSSTSTRQSRWAQIRQNASVRAAEHRRTQLQARRPKLLRRHSLSTSTRAQAFERILPTIQGAIHRRRHSIATSTYKMAGNNALPALEIPMSGGNRSSPSPTSSVVGAQTNGANAAAYGPPLNAGHQQDLNYLYNQIQELSALLKANREKTAVLTKAAEEIGRRAQNNGLRSDSEADGSVQSDQARIRELERTIAKKDSLIATYAHEQRENTSLIALYENAVGTMTEQIRNYCLGIEGRFLAQKRHYNDLLQAEKDEHLASRLDRDHWHAQTLKCAEMIRTAHRLRTDEWCEEYAVVAGLQGEVRCYRRVLGMDPQKPEEEGGWPYLKDLPLNDTGPI